MRNEIDELVIKELGGEVVEMELNDDVVLIVVDGLKHYYNSFQPSQCFQDCGVIIDLLRKQSDWGVHLSSYRDKFIANWHRYTVTADTPALAVSKMFLLSRGIEVR